MNEKEIREASASLKSKVAALAMTQMTIFATAGDKQVDRLMNYEFLVYMGLIDEVLNQDLPSDMTGFALLNWKCKNISQLTLELREKVLAENKEED